MRKRMKKFGAVIMAVALTVSGWNGTGMVYGASEGNSAAEDDPIEATVNGQVYFVQSGTKTVITLDGTDRGPIECNVKYQPKTEGFSTENVPQNGLFTIRYGEYDGKDIVNFSNPSNNANWKADENDVYQILNHQNPSGWESVRMEPQGDGTVAFKSSAVEKYLTLGENGMQLISIGKDEAVSSNEKFILYTDTTPKTAKNVTVTEKSGDTVSLSWNSVRETMYCGYEVLYATSENGTYQSAGQTASTSFEVSDLSVNTKYYFKIRTLTNNVGGPYADSKIIYTTTSSDLKPKTTKNVTVKETENGLAVSWDSAANAKSYKVLSAQGKYGNFQTVAMTTETTCTVPVGEGSKYNKYFKVVSVNNESESSASEAVSLETMLFGKNTYIFNDEDDDAQIKSVVENIFTKQHYNQFGTRRYAFLFKQGNYLDTGVLNIGYYTQILGLGKSPEDVNLYNVHTPAALSGNNVTCNFWVGIENATIKDLENNGDSYFWFRWAASQAAPARRMNVERHSVFEWPWNGYASGGFFADSRFQKPAGSYSQQQYYYRNCDFVQSNYGVNWNQVIQGSTGIEKGTEAGDNYRKLDVTEELISKEGYSNWANSGCTTVINETKVTREKPFLYYDEEQDEYRVFVPALKKNSKGISWDKGMGAGTSISLEKYFYIAHPETDNAASINKQIRAGKNVLFTPGIYYVESPIEVNTADTILLGIGMATIQPNNSDSAIKVADVGGVEVAGLILDAGNQSKTLLQVGEEGCNKDHSENPTVLHDVIYRVGGAGHLGRVESCQVINSNDVIIDHTWIWRADHGENTGWYANTSKNGLVVNGDRVTAYGLFCEHFQEYDILWRGEEGATYFFQNEKCYDPQKQSEWMSHGGTKKGYAAYKVANNVKKHYAVGLGIYDVFIYTNGASIYVDNAIEVPDTKGVLIENLCTVELSGDGAPGVGMNHMTNDVAPGIRQGAGTNGGFAVQTLLSYTDGIGRYMPDYYQDRDGTTVQQGVGTTPTNDEKAEKDIQKDESSKDDEKPLWEMTDDDFKKKMEDAALNNYTEEPKPEGPIPEEPTTGTGTNPGTNPKTAETLKKNQKITVGKYTYKVSSVSGKQGKVILTGVVKKYQKKLKKVSVKATVSYKGYQLKVTVIGKKAFNKCKKLKKVTLGKNVTQVQAKAFGNCKKLKNLIVKGKKLKKFARNALNQKIQKSVKIKATAKVKKKLFKILKR